MAIDRPKTTESGGMLGSHTPDNLGLDAEVSLAICWPARSTIYLPIFTGIASSIEVKP